MHITNTFFSLPDDFNGTYSDALRIMADYLESPAPDLGKNPETDFKETNEDPWKSYLETVHKGGKVNGIFGLKYWNGKEWVDILK